MYLSVSEVYFYLVGWSMDLEGVELQCLRPKVRRTSYRYRGSKKDRATIKQILSQPGRLRRGVLQWLHNKTNVPVRTLKEWRSGLLDPNRPDYDPFKRSPHPPRALPKSIEDQIFQAVNQRIQAKMYTPRAFVRRIAQDLGKPVNPKFKAGRKWFRNFLHRYKLSLRIPHAKRRTTPNDEHLSGFLEEFEIAKMQLPRTLILNMDETSWRLNNGTLRTVARRGADDVTVDLSVDERTSITVICCVTASGKKLAPWAIIKGKTARCEARYRDSDKLRRLIGGKRLILDHTESGWATAALMERYLSWLSKQLGGRFSYLLWDLHSSHRDQGVKEKAHKKNVNLSFIPAGQTGEWQPLDRRIFGAVKRQAEERLNEICVDQDLANLDMMDALAILVDVWEQIPAEDIKKSWSHLFIADDLPVEVQANEEEEAESEAESPEEFDYEEEEEEDVSEQFVEEVMENAAPDEEEDEEDEEDHLYQPIPEEELRRAVEEEEEMEYNYEEEDEEEDWETHWRSVLKRACRLWMRMRAAGMLDD